MSVPPLVGYQAQWPSNAGAKPLIDILLGAPSWALIEAQVPALAEIGQTYRPEYEAPLPVRRYFVRPAQGVMPRIHLHVAPRRRSGPNPHG